MVITPDFKFRSNHTVEFNFTVIPHLQDEAPHIFKIYQGAPDRGGKLLNQGITDNAFKYSASINIADRIDSIFIENRNADGIYELIGFKLSSNTINHVFNTNTLLNGFLNTKSISVDPGCGSDCDEMTSGTHNNLLLDKDDYCVAAGTTLDISGQLQFKRGVSLVICGDATINNFTITDNRKVKIYVSQSGSLTIPGNLIVPEKLSIYNFGDLDIVGNLTTTKKENFKNYETMNVGGNFINYSEKFLNEGVINITGNYITYDSNRSKNYGTMNVGGNAELNSKHFFENYCKLKVDGNLVLNDRLRNYSYIEIDGNLVVNSGARYYSYNGGLTKTNNLVNNGDLRGAGNAYSKIDISQSTILNSGSYVSNKMDICDANGIETNNATIHNRVVFCEITIPQSTCNPGSSGGTANLDSDNDGVPDTDDQYPEDPDLAFVSYYPNQEDFATLAFEDLWPGRGDYDFNDLVLDIQYKIITNAQNKIAKIEAQTHVRAAGATLDNGFGIAFPTATANCEQVSGYRHVKNSLNINAKGYENGHTDETVVIFYDAINSIYSNNIINTDLSRTYITTDTITVSIKFSNPNMEIGNEPYNPFIYVDQERGKEIHMIDNAPTSLVNSNYFNTMHDNSNASIGRYYVTEKNLPWAVEIPASFDYAVEKADILSTYLKFEAWATSSGNQFKDWYVDKPGYRNTENIYIKPE